MTCDFVVDGRMAFLDFMQAHAHDVAAASPSMPVKDPQVVWRHVRWCGSAEVGGFTYVVALSGEAQIELLLKRRAAGIVVYYEYLSVDGWGDAAVGEWEVEDSTRQLIEHHLKTADALLDKAPAYFD
jgi:hypothetical protein